MPHLPRFTLVCLLAVTLSGAFAADATPALAAESDNAELARLYAEDQADRKPAPGKEIDWNVVGPRDDARLARIKELYATNQLRTGADFYHAAMILQHGDVPEDYLLAHELCVVAISKGYSRALWLAAASQDRFLRAIGRPQRFGTQYRSEGGGATYLQETDESVTDEHRRLMKAPSLAEARARASKFDGARPSLAALGDAPALTQDIFTATDDANTALEKLRKVKAQTPEEALRLVQGCRDLCRRYTAPFPRAMAMMLALDHWRKLPPEHIGRLAGWDPALGEDDPEIPADLRANIGQRLAYSRAARRVQGEGLSWEDALLLETAALVIKLPTARSAHDALIGAALAAVPEKAIAALREHLPDNAAAASAIQQLERIGKRCEIKLTTLDGGTLTTAGLRGKVVIVHFFNARYANSAGKLKELLAQHANDLAVVGIYSERSRAELDPLVATQAITWPVHHQPAGWRGEISPPVPGEYSALLSLARPSRKSALPRRAGDRAHGARQDRRAATGARALSLPRRASGRRPAASHPPSM